MPAFGCPNRYTGLPNGLDTSLQISGEQKTLKKYFKSTRIMNVNWLFIAAGMDYVQKNLNKGKVACLLSIFMSTSRQRLQSHASVFRRKTESNNYTV